MQARSTCGENRTTIMLAKSVLQCKMLHLIFIAWYLLLLYKTVQVLAEMWWTLKIGSARGVRRRTRVARYEVTTLEAERWLCSQPIPIVSETRFCTRRGTTRRLFNKKYINSC